MAQLFTWLKSIRPKQILVSLLAGLFVVLGTACSSPGANAQAYRGPEGNIPRQGGVQQYKGGMNNYNDTNSPRADKAEAQAKSLRKEVERNISDKRAETPGQFSKNFKSGTPLGERAQNFAEDVKEGAKGIGQDAKTYLYDENTPNRAANAADHVKDTVKAANRDLRESAKENVRGTTNFMEDTTKRMGDVPSGHSS